jgi:hypothetical protein
MFHLSARAVEPFTRSLAGMAFAISVIARSWPLVQAVARRRSQEPISLGVRTLMPFPKPPMRPVSRKRLPSRHSAGTMAIPQDGSPLPLWRGRARPSAGRWSEMAGRAVAALMNGPRAWQ